MTSSMSLEAFRAWSEQYQNFMKQSEKAFKEQGLKTARAYLTKAIATKLSTMLMTMVDDGNGKPKVTEETLIC